MTVPVIAIDGPSGSGKGTVARLVAARLGWQLLDSGALYRLVALAGLRRGLAADDAEGHARAAAMLEARFGMDAGGAEQVFLDGADVTRELRAEQTGELASRVAALPAVRAALLDRQRAFARPPGLVADGRDMGSVVFPDAGLKLFLTASPEERALRRYKQLKEKGLGGNLAALSAEIAERDRRDATRAVAPLLAGAGAIVVDSTALSIEEVVTRVLALARERFPGVGRGD
ncbi:MAG: (d)CMP kinase [Gammaproteobacteria bacterium]|nr:(d)CMP kinase [Gammaproteobacteria bacterium]